MGDTKRIFIAIHLPDDLKTRLLEFKKLIPDVGGRWTALGNIHITLVFIGYVTEDELQAIHRVVGEVAKRHGPFDVFLERVILGPPQGPPRMVWATIGKSEALLKLQSDLETALYDNKGTGYNERENRPYSPHLTLCRFETHEFLRVARAAKVDYPFGESFSVTSIEVMESVLKRSGAEYSVVKSYPVAQ